MSKALELVVLSPKGEVLRAAPQSVRLPATDGSLGIMPGHRTMLVALGPGDILYKEAGLQQRLSITGGLAEVEQDRVVVLVDAT